jgi:hypothetical protein
MFSLASQVIPDFLLVSANIDKPSVVYPVSPAAWAWVNDNKPNEQGWLLSGDDTLEAFLSGLEDAGYYVKVS